MATFSKVIPSGSTQGKAVKIAATASVGTTLHATGTSSTIVDEVWVYAYNSDSSARNLTVQFGGTATPDNDITLSIPAQAGLTLVVPGFPLTGTGSAANTVYAYAAVTNVITCYVYVNRQS